MRCLTLANELKCIDDIYIRFLCRHIPESLHELIQKNEHDIVMLKHVDAVEQQDELKHSYLLRTSQAQDATDTIKALSDKSWDWLIVDHYSIDERYESKLRSYVENIMVIDDIADRGHDCDVLLDQNIYFDMEKRYINKVPNRCQTILGPDYALLRNEFSRLHNKMEPNTKPIERVLIFFGGIDPENLTGMSINAINSLKCKRLNVDVVIGIEHPNRKEIERTCELLNYNCHIQTERMAEIIASSDLAIGAGGSASWERCCLGVATISVAFADNQHAIARELDRVGACIFLGDHTSINQKMIEDTVSELILDYERVKSMSTIGYSIVDGQGAKRVCEILNQF